MIRKLLQIFRKTGPKKSPAERMLTLDCAKVYYLPITKCGSTYLKNLFYYLDHANEHTAGDFIHANPQDLKRAKVGDLEAIKNSPFAFTVLRDPVDRFTSMYFDKIYGDGPQRFKKERLYLEKEIGLDLTRNLDVTMHRQNCNKLIVWVEKNLKHKTDRTTSFHWKRQSNRLKRVQELKLRHLTLDGLSAQLPVFLKQALPDIEEAMFVVKSINKSQKPDDFDKIADQALREKIEAVYARDHQLYNTATEYWQKRLAG